MYKNFIEIFVYTVYIFGKVCINVFKPIVLEDSDEDSDTIIIEDFEDDDCYVTTSSFGPGRSHSPLIIESDDDSDILADDDILVDEDIISK